MMRSFLSSTLLLVTVLASRAFALNNIALGGSVGNVSATNFLTVNDAQLTKDCATQCAPANNAIQACTTDACLCDSATVTAITACEQCMFDALIANDTTSADPRAGSATALTAYAAACAAQNLTVPTSEITLTDPSDWDGPFGQGLGIPATVLTVGVGAALASGAIFIINTM